MNAEWCFAEPSWCINYFLENQNWYHLKQKEGAEGLVLAPLQLLFAFMCQGLCLLFFPVPPSTKTLTGEAPSNSPCGIVLQRNPNHSAWQAGTGLLMWAGDESDSPQHQPETAAGKGAINIFSSHECLLSFHTLRVINTSSQLCIRAGLESFIPKLSALLQLLACGAASQISARAGFHNSLHFCWRVSLPSL